MFPDFLSLIFLLISLNFTACSGHTNTPQLFHFEKTLRLVAFIEEAAGRVWKNGNETFDEYQDERSKWFYGNLNLFVYDLNGVRAFHQISPELT